MRAADATRIARLAPLLAVLTLLTALAPCSIDVYTPSLPRIRADLGGAEWVVQATITACLLGIGCGQLVLGPLSDRIGRRPVLLVGVAGWTAASIVSALVPSAWALLIVRAVAGFAGAAGIVVARSVVRDVSDSQRAVGARISLLATVSAAAPVVAPAVGTAIALRWGWRADFGALAVLGAVVLVGVLVLVPESLPAGRRQPPAPILGSIADALHDAELRSVALALGIQAFGFYAYVATASFVVEQQLGYEPAAFAAMFGTNAVAMLAANLLFRRLVRRTAPAFLLGVGFGVALLGGLVLAGTAVVGGPEGLLWAGSAIFAASIGFVLPSAHSWGQHTAPPSGAASGVTGSAQFLGGVLGSPVTGLLGPTALTLGVLVAGSSTLALVPWRLAMSARAERQSTVRRTA